MEFNVEIRNGRPIANFSIYHDIRDWLLFAFLEEARSSLGEQACWEGLEISDKNRNSKCGQLDILHQFTSDNVHMAFYKDRVEIEELFPENDDNPECLSISIAEAKELLIKWGKVMSRWRDTQMT
jgi:hypothetical protein